MNRDNMLSRFKKAIPVTKGFSRDKKYHCFLEGKESLLIISDGKRYEQKKREYEYLKHLSEAGLPVPECREFFLSDDEREVYTLLSWIPGTEAEKLIPRLRPEQQYALGLQAGDILRKIHENSPEVNVPDSWYDRYFAVMEPRLEAYRREGFPFDGSDEVLRYLEENRELLKSRPLCHLHGDYHMRNLIVNEGTLQVIDWQTVDFDNIGDPWYEFNCLGTDHPEFAKGQIDGYFQKEVPDTFWKLFAYYLSASALTSIVWARYQASGELGGIMRLNVSVAEMFDHMKDHIPSWYR